MIFITLGTEQFQLNRLLIQLDLWVEEKKITTPLLAQRGHSTYEPKNFRSQTFFSFQEIREKIGQSEGVISHGGAGSTLLCLELKKKLLLVPRDPSLNEHVDNHQLEFCKKLELTGYLRVAYQLGTILSWINQLPEPKNTYEHKASPLSDNLKGWFSHGN